MNVQQLLNLTDSMYPNGEDNNTKIAYMNMAIDSLSAEFGRTAVDESVVTVAGQDEYTFPDGVEDINQIIGLGVGNSVTPDSRYEYTPYMLGYKEDNPLLYRTYFQIYDDEGDKTLGLYPAPTVSGLPIRIRYHRILAKLSPTSLTQVPEFDSRYHFILAVYACFKICSTGPSPDAIQANTFMQQYDDTLMEMWKNKMNADLEQRDRTAYDRTWRRR